ncbi:MAG: 2-hydroxyglutaryl-CoA dehydratase, partial [Clostridia bacterium]|nr:2-hydroxyglutaryl-CoA dehydratase [Clostridia bacterium]
LNLLAAAHKAIYPIAARCGVFAKTDIQALLNAGATQEDIAASVFQAVVNQVIGGLACGRKIRGKIALLGGPLYFLPELRRIFRETLGLPESALILPEQAQVYVAIGAALAAKAPESATKQSLRGLIAKIKSKPPQQSALTAGLAPLFADKGQYRRFVARHNGGKAMRQGLSSSAGGCFLGLDIGSTTCKAALIDDQARLLFSYYASNGGEPLQSARHMLRAVYDNLPAGAAIAYSCVTGYGEDLIKAAFGCDMGEVETMAHLAAAEFFLPGVQTVLDIGGQDMKCLKIRDGAIENVILNEACSSGCGSFIETFAQSLGLDIEAFTQAALTARAPVDLGTRCTVFMNSRVRQAQKDGAAIGDIAAGLCYSVVKNALYKVIKMRCPEELGAKIIVQGGVFSNDAILRCFELLAAKEVTRPDIPELMGAFGAALLAQKSWRRGMVSTLIPAAALARFSAQVQTRRCGHCGNHCLLTINSFNNGQKLITGNRCEQGAGNGHAARAANLYAYKYQRLFQYQPLPPEQAPRGELGIPRVLNMYENYPFWHTFFTALGFRVILSPPSSRDIYALGMDTISSDTACYPAKLANGHIIALINQGLRHIFYPCLPKERAEFKAADNHYNCPLVACYAEIIRANIDLLAERQVKLYHPFLPYNDDKRLAERLFAELADFGLSRSEVRRAVAMARAEDHRFKADMRRQGEDLLRELRRTGQSGVVLSGRPYHLDPEVHHGIPELITSLGLAVFTEDSLAHLGKVERPLRVLDQWMYHTRLYEAADFVSRQDNLQLVQLNSFGCGPDSIAAEQAGEILRPKHKLHTVIKIDEVSNLGAIKIRLRSLQAAMQGDMAERRRNLPAPCAKADFAGKRRLRQYTILGPQMAPIHFQLIEAAVCSAGYRFAVLADVKQEDIEAGLKYVNQDICYPAMIIVGQIINALRSGRYDPDQTAIIMPQTGGPCKASNYTALLKLALRENGLGHVPILTLSAVKTRRSAHFPISPALAKKAVMALIYGDLLMALVHQVRPYEKKSGATEQLLALWLAAAKENIAQGSREIFRENLAGIARGFAAIEIKDEERLKVGLVGEIMVKYHPFANNHLAEFLESAGAEMVVPSLTDFFLYGAFNRQLKQSYLDGGRLQSLLGAACIKYLESYRDDMRQALRPLKRFVAPEHIRDLAAKARPFLSLCNQTGEGWLLTAEIVDLIEKGANAIICMQPFACLPNHISGRGMIKSLKEKYPHVRIIAIDYDASASYVNQINRVRLLLDGCRAQ